MASLAKISHTHLILESPHPPQSLPSLGWIRPQFLLARKFKVPVEAYQATMRGEGKCQKLGSRPYSFFNSACRCVDFLIYILEYRKISYWSRHCLTLTYLLSLDLYNIPQGRKYACFDK